MTHQKRFCLNINLNVDVVHILMWAVVLTIVLVG